MVVKSDFYRCQNKWSQVPWDSYSWNPPPQKNTEKDVGNSLIRDQRSDLIEQKLSVCSFSKNKGENLFSIPQKKKKVPELTNFGNRMVISIPLLKHLFCFPR